MFAAPSDSGNTEGIVALRNGPRFHVRNKMDVWALKETFLDRFYERYGAPIQDGWHVVDIGAGIGDFTVFAASAGPGVVVHGYEPFPRSFDLLNENLQLNGVANAEVFNRAVGGKAERLGFETFGFDAGKTVMRPAGEGAIWSLPFAEVLGRIGACNLLKMDCEGAEYSILLDSPDGIFKYVERIVMEYHDVAAGQHPALEKRLAELGYRVSTVPNQVHTDIGYMYAER